MNRLFLYQLSMLLAVVSGQQHRSANPTESVEFTKRRQEFHQQQFQTPERAPDSQETRQLSQLQAEVQRSEELVRREMERLHHLRRQQVALSHQQVGPPVSTTPRLVATPPPGPRVVATPPPSPRLVATPPPSPRVVATPPPPRATPPTQQSFRQAVDEAEELEHLARKQAENARYTFSSTVNDGIFDSSHVREETREGLNVQGMYSYSDGFFKRTVHYEADENGYRVVSEKSEPIGEGPLFNAAGTAEVSSVVSGIGSGYHITAADIPAIHPDRTTHERKGHQTSHHARPIVVV